MKYDKTKDYCTLSPDKLLGVNHNYACYCHDVRYYKKDTTRKVADQRLRDRMYNIYKKAELQYIGWLISRIYYIGVRLFGWIIWQK